MVVKTQGGCYVDGKYVPLCKMNKAGLLSNDNSKLIAVKPRSSISNEVQKAINVISFDKENVVPFGSWIYKAAPFPGDIDLIETDTKCCDRDDTISFFAKGFQKIVKRIIRTKGFYLGDIKAGLDDAFIVDMGELKFDKNGVSSIIGYNMYKVLEQLKHLHDEDILNSDDYESMLKLTKQNINQQDFEELYDMIRDKRIVRWTGPEISSGFKLLPGNRKITLKHAIAQQTISKIDMWTLINGRFQEVTDLYTFIFKNIKGETEVLNYENDIEHLEESLKIEIQKYAFSKKFFKPFKMVKRMWSLARITKDLRMVKILTPLVQSDVGRLSQMNSDIEVIIDILAKVKSPPLPSILKEIDNFRPRLANAYEINIDEQRLDDMIVDILKHKNNTVKDKKYIINELHKIKEYLAILIKNETVKYLNKVGLVPIPYSYLP